MAYANVVWSNGWSCTRAMYPTLLALDTRRDLPHTCIDCNGSWLPNSRD
jgi:hypothetical protein